MRHTRVHSIAFILAAIAVMAPAAALATPPDTYIRAGHLLDVRAGKMLSNQIIVIHAEKIASIAPADQVQIPAGANVIDLTQSTVLPGLIDCHTHIMLTDTDDSHYDDILLKQSWQYRTILATLNVKKDLEAGFTAMRDVETEGAMYSDVDVRNAINQGLIPGPRLKVATRGISTTGGYGLEGYSPEVTVPIGVQTIDGPYEARKAVREQFNYGADLIKLVADNTGAYYYSEEEIRAATNEAHSANRAVAVHVLGGQAARNVIMGGADSIEHGWTLDDDLLRLMKEKGVFLAGTDFPAIHLKAAGYHNADKIGANIIDRLTRAYKIGVKLTFSTDTVTEMPNETRADMAWDYLAVWRAAGVPPNEILKAMTTNAAELLRIQKERGAIATGLYADIIAMPSSPLDDIESMRKINFVMKNGAVIRNDAPKNPK